jgi:hypothetical protein
MSDDVTEFRYVLRFLSKMWGTNGQVQYDGSLEGTFNCAQKYTLAEANARLKELYESAMHHGPNLSPPVREIVRVRHVASEDQWREAAASESAEYGFQYGDDVTRRFGQNEPAHGTRLQKRIPGVPRWEVVEE